MTLRAGEAVLTAAAAPGAPITSLCVSGVEWLARPVRARPTVIGPDLPWASADCGGWDECFPNVAAAPPRGLDDHGDVWRAPVRWRVEGNRAISVAEVDRRGRRYRFTRTLTLRPDLLEVAYRVRNLATTPLRWAWAQHAMLAADTATTLRLPAPVAVRVDSAFAEGVPGDAAWLCPDGRLMDTISLAGAHGRAAKVWLQDRPDWIAVIRDGAWLAWDLRSSTTPDVGLWINLDGWRDAGRPLCHVGVEPAFGAHDDPVRALAEGAGPILPPGGTADWSCALRFGRTTKALSN